MRPADIVCVGAAALLLSACAHEPTQSPENDEPTEAITSPAPGATALTEPHEAGDTVNAGATEVPPEASPADAGTGLAPDVSRQALIEVLPHIRIDRYRAMVEFDGVIAIDAHHPQTPIVYLEQLVCTPDSLEHESIVMTEARPSHVHAALVMVGAEPGRPGSWEMEGNEIVAVPPTGSSLSVKFVTTDANGSEHEHDACEWAIRIDTGENLCDALARGAKRQWAFGGSRMRTWRGAEVYEADMTGTLVGLCTFGSESIAAGAMFHHESAFEEPVWIANNSLIPKQFEPVRVRIYVRQD